MVHSLTSYTITENFMIIYSAFENALAAFRISIGVVGVGVLTDRIFCCIKTVKAVPVETEACNDKTVNATENINISKWVKYDSEFLRKPWVANAYLCGAVLIIVIGTTLIATYGGENCVLRGLGIIIYSIAVALAVTILAHVLNIGDIASTLHM
ncbi:uncharacterized protein BXIN_0186 [Babesia sp. Xinjiang]|uniref:uncharacterized protein n=1 Tax=Babesia sp. Xinjiang TaxID=462227 RepID=UPI000A24D4F8|nr:uncharacterized protein BXIN_0186 [Babesia sp. Xinjiang]ORM39856.1 hypothetical protein BXIN_0186 [Babesia sp. Xinjiang]